MSGVGGTVRADPFKGTYDASALRPKSNARRPVNRIILAHVLTRWLVSMDPAGRGVLQQHLGGNVVPVAAPNEDTPEHMVVLFA